MSRILGLFPGQGSQQVGMGRELYEEHSVARDLFERANTALGFSLSSICFNGPAEELSRTEITQPAILTVSTICLSVVENRLGFRFPFIAAAGHSLGEYSALVAAGAIEFEDAVRLVHKRGRYMQEAVPNGEGKMVAVLGKQRDEIELALAKVSEGIAEIANINAGGQIVVAGHRTGVDEFLSHLGPAKAIDLPVSAPFHTTLMEPAAAKLHEDLAAIQISVPRFPVLSNFFARPLTEPSQIREALSRQVCGTVRWVECMECALTEYQPTLTVEFGAGSVLCGLMKRINRGMQCLNVSELSEVEGLLSHEFLRAA